MKISDNKVFLISKLVNLKFKEESSVTEHLNETQSIMNQLVSMKMILEGKFQSLLLLISLQIVGRLW